MDSRRSSAFASPIRSVTVVVMISGHATIQTAVEATQLGAYDILEKPLDTDRILVTLRNALAAPRAARGEQPASGDDRVALRDRREVVRDPRADREDRESRGHPGARAHHRRERDRQGAGGARHPPAVAAPRQAVRRGELRGDPGRADRERAVRSHARLVHRRGQRPRREVRAGEWRHALSRRGR